MSYYALLRLSLAGSQRSTTEANIPSWSKRRSREAAQAAGDLATEAVPCQLQGFEGTFAKLRGNSAIQLIIGELQPFQRPMFHHCPGKRPSQEDIQCDIAQVD